jgi:hypothetical protein
MLTVFDAMEEAKVARICMISAADLRDRSQPPPSHYNEADLAMSDRMWSESNDIFHSRSDLLRA